MSHHPEQPVLNERLEIHESKSSKVLGRFVLPIFLATGAIWVSWFAFNEDHSSSERLQLLLGSGFCCWLPLCFWILAIPRFFSSKPRLVIDEQGITDSWTRRPKTTLWQDIERVSFPYRHSGRYSRSYRLSIKLKNPQEHLSKVARFLNRLNANLVPNLGDYEIRFSDFNIDILGAYYHIVELQRHERIPATVKIDRITEGPLATIDPL